MALFIVIPKSYTEPMSTLGYADFINGDETARQAALQLAQSKANETKNPYLVIEGSSSTEMSPIQP